MTIAKGRTDCKSERDIIIQGFNDLLRVLMEAKKQMEGYAKAALYDIINDNTLSDEERWTQMKPFNDLLSEREETDIRIRRNILIGMFAFWELSLKDICGYYKIDVGATKGPKAQNDKKLPKGERTYVNDYINAIFRLERPNVIELIITEIRELRNFMTHGSADEKRRSIIDKLIASHPEYYIAKNCGNYHISSYKGLYNILMDIYDGLQIAETATKTIAESNKSRKI